MGILLPISISLYHPWLVTNNFFAKDKDFQISKQINLGVDQLDRLGKIDEGIYLESSLIDFVLKFTLICMPIPFLDYLKVLFISWKISLVICLGITPL